MRDVARLLLMIPMSIGWIVGFLVSPFLTGFISGSNICESLIDRLDER